MEHGAIPNLGEEGDITPTQTTGEGLGKTANRWEGQHGKGSYRIIQDSSVSLGGGVVPGQVNSKQGLSSYVPSWVGDRGEDT